MATTKKIEQTPAPEATLPDAADTPTTTGTPPVATPAPEAPAPAGQTIVHQQPMVKIKVLKNRLPIDEFEHSYGKKMMLEADRAEILQQKKLVEIIGA